MKPLMNNVRIFLLLSCVLLVSACSDGGGSGNWLQAERNWYWEHELSGSNARIATEQHTVVLLLKPGATAYKAAGGSTSVKTLPYTYKKSGKYEYCIAANDPYFVGMTITSEDTGKPVATVQQGACVQADISAGKHTVALTHKQLAAGAKERLAFVGVPNAVKPATKSNTVASTGAEPAKFANSNPGDPGSALNLASSTITLSGNSCRYCNLSGLSLGNSGSGTWFDTYDFTGADFSNSSFTNVTIFNCNFTGAILTGSTITTTIYDGGGINTCNFTSAKMNKITITGEQETGLMYSTFDMADFTGASITKAYIYNSLFRSATMANATITASTIDCDNDNYETDSSKCFSNKPGEQLDLSNSIIISDTFDKYSYFVASRMDPTDLYGGDPSNSQYFNLNHTVFKQPFTLSNTNKSTDLSNANFSGAIFADGMVVESVKKSCADMSTLTGCVNFSGTTMPSASFKNSKLNGANFAFANLSSASFTESVLNGASLQGARGASQTSFMRAQMVKADLSNARFSGSIFQGAVLTSANLSGSAFIGSKFNKDPNSNVSARLDNAFLYNTNMQSADLSGVSMTNVSFHSTTKSNVCQDKTDVPSRCASAYKAIMANSNLTGAYLASLDMSGATLNGAILNSSFAMGANFNGAQLLVDPTTGTAVSFSQAILFGADFTNAMTKNSNFSNAFFDDQITPAKAGTTVAYLGYLYTSFAGAQSEYKDHVCAWYQSAGVTGSKPSGLTASGTPAVVPLPPTDSTVVCPDQTRGPCSGGQWKASQLLDISKVVLTYLGQTGAPAACNGDFIQWTNISSQ